MKNQEKPDDSDKRFSEIVYEWRESYITKKPKTKLEPEIQREIAKRTQDELARIRAQRQR